MGYYVVEQVTEKPGCVLAELRPVTWFKTNPAFTAWQQLPQDDESDAPDEFIDAQPGEEGAEAMEEGPRITLDITNGPEMHPLDNVLVEYRVLTPVEV